MFRMKISWKWKHEAMQSAIY